MKRESMAPSWELLLTSLSQFERRFHAQSHQTTIPHWFVDHQHILAFFSSKMIPQHVACMIWTHLPMITWDHDLTIIARHRAQPRWPLLLATNSRLRHLALAAMKASGIGYSRRLVNNDKIATKMQNILCLLSCKLSSLNTANNFQQVRPNCLQNQKCWMKPFDWALSSRNSYTRVALLRCHANKHSLLSCPGTSTSSNPWFGQKDHMIYHPLGSIWPNKSRPRILTHLIWFILTYDDLSMSSVHRFLMHLWIAICAQLPPALDERACHPFVCRSP